MLSVHANALHARSALSNLVRLSAGNFSRIIVYDRASHRLVEEQISATLVLAMRNMYQSKVARLVNALQTRERDV